MLFMATHRPIVQNRPIQPTRRIYSSRYVILAKILAEPSRDTGECCSAIPAVPYSRAAARRPNWRSSTAGRAPPVLAAPRSSSGDVESSGLRCRRCLRFLRRRRYAFACRRRPLDRRRSRGLAWRGSMPLDGRDAIRGTYCLRRR